MSKILTFATAATTLALLGGCAANTASNGQTRAAMALNQQVDTAYSPHDTAEALSAGNRNDWWTTAALAKKADREYSDPAAEYILASSYESTGRYDMALPLYRDLMAQGSNTKIVAVASDSGGIRPRLGDTYAIEASYRVDSIMAKQLPEAQNAIYTPHSVSALTAEFNLATGYQNMGSYAPAALLYKDLVITGSNATIALKPNADGSMGELLNRNLSDEAARRLDMMSAKRAPVLQGSGEAGPTS